MPRKWIPITQTHIIQFIFQWWYFTRSLYDPRPFLTPPVPPPPPTPNSLQRRRQASQPGCQLLAWPAMCFKCCCRLVMRCAACQAAGLLKQMGNQWLKSRPSFGIGPEHNLPRRAAALPEGYGQTSFTPPPLRPWKSFSWGLCCATVFRFNNDSWDNKNLMLLNNNNLVEPCAKQKIYRQFPFLFMHQVK